MENSNQMRKVRRATQLNDGYETSGYAPIPRRQSATQNIGRNTAPQSITQRATTDRRNIQRSTTAHGMPYSHELDELVEEEHEGDFVYQQPIRRSGTVARNNTVTRAYPRRRQSAVSLSGIFLFLGTVLLIILLFLVVQLAVSTFTDVHDYLMYGVPRISKTMAVVGHNNDSQLDPSIFEGLNTRGQVTVIECPASDCTKAITYVGPSLTSSKTPVTITFNNEKTMMIVKFDSRTWILQNTGKQFNVKSSKLLIQ